MEQQPQETKANKNKSIATLILAGLSLLLLMGCGAVIVIQRGDLEKKDKEIADLAKKIEEKKTDEKSEETDKEMKPSLTSDEVLKLMKKRVKELGYGYDIENANIIGKKKGEEIYWTTYCATNGDGASVIFTKKADGEWDFDIPGFTGFTDETTDGFEFDPEISFIRN